MPDDAINIPRVFGLCNDLRKADPEHRKAGASDIDVISAHLACALTGLEAIGVADTGMSARKLLNILEQQLKRAARTLRERDAASPIVLTGEEQKVDA